LTAIELVPRSTPSKSPTHLKDSNFTCLCLSIHGIVEDMGASFVAKEKQKQAEKYGL